MIHKNTPTFGKDGKRRIKCRNCRRVFGSRDGGAIYSYLTDNKAKLLKCPECKYEGYYAAPIPDPDDPFRLYWGADEHGLNGTTTIVDENK